MQALGSKGGGNVVILTVPGLPGRCAMADGQGSCVDLLNTIVTGPNAGVGPECVKCASHIGDQREVVAAGQEAGVIESRQPSAGIIGINPRRRTHGAHSQQAARPIRSRNP